MTASPTAPAAMPSEEEIARVICCPDGCDGDTGSGRPCDIRREDRTSMMQARAVRALFAPILAEKERLERNRDMWKGQCERQAEALRQNAIAFQGKCLDLDAAEAALAAERAMLKRIVDLHADWRLCMPKDWEGDPLSDACEDAAAAIRAQGE